MHQQQTDFETLLEKEKLLATSNFSFSRSFSNMVDKGEIARNKQFLIFPQCFLLIQIILSPFVHIFDIISLFAKEFEEPKIGISDKGLRAKDNQSERIHSSLSLHAAVVLIIVIILGKQPVAWK